MVSIDPKPQKTSKMDFTLHMKGGGVSINPWNSQWELTWQEVDPGSQPFEHVARVPERVDGEHEPHQHQNHADDAEEHFGSRIIWNQTKSDQIRQSHVYFPLKNWKKRDLCIHKILHLAFFRSWKISLNWQILSFQFRIVLFQ